MKSMKKIIGKLKINEKYKGIVIGFALAFLLLACVGVTYSWFRALTEGEGYKYTSGSSYFYYGAYTRLGTNKAPTYVCSQLNDRFTTTGNGRLYNASGIASPIATITVDELSYAGGLLGTNNTSYYIYQNASSGPYYWWTMSPFCWGGVGADVWSVGGSTDGGGFFNDYVDVTVGVRPVVSLKSCVQWSLGNGTTATPYQVRINSSCISAEN